MMSSAEKTLVYADDCLIRRRSLETKRSTPRRVAVGLLRERLDGRSYREGSKRIIVCVFGNEESGAHLGSGVSNVEGRAVCD